MGIENKVEDEFVNLNDMNEDYRVQIILKRTEYLKEDQKDAEKYGVVMENE